MFPMFTLNVSNVSMFIEQFQGYRASLQWTEVEYNVKDKDVKIRQNRAEGIVNGGLLNFIAALDDRITPIKIESLIYPVSRRLFPKQAW